MQKSLSIARNDKSVSLLSDVLLRATVLMSFILLKVLFIMVDQTGIVITSIRSDKILENACFNHNTSKYKSIIFLGFNCFNVGVST